MLDQIIFGNPESEKLHAFSSTFSVVCGGEAPSRQALPTEPISRFSGEYNFRLKVDPTGQNYLSVKLISSDRYSPLFLLIDGKQLGYAKCGDYEALNLGHGEFYPHTYFYMTSLIPLIFTSGKSEITLTLRHAMAYDPITSPCGRIFSAFTHTDPYFKIEGCPLPPRSLPHEEITGNDIASLSARYIEKQREAFNASLALLIGGEKISITKYVESFRQFCMILFEPYCPLKTAREKGEGVKLILNCIDLYVRDYFFDVRTLAHTSHQSDWGGYYGELGQGLYLLEPLIKNDDILGAEKFAAYLNEPFNCESEEGVYSLPGSHITRKEAWERCLKANFDFASARQSYIFNQIYYTYEGAWKSMAGLGVIGSKYYIGDEKCRRLLLEALGIAPWRGEHILTDENGRELDLYHCLFHHDKAARFTDDFLKIVCKGQAVQKTDENGDFVRRRPYGDNYTSLTHAAMPRENGYVANYGETANYLPEWVWRTFNHGDLELSDTILRAALKNIHSRGFMRHQSVDENGFRVMHMEQATDERNPALPGKVAYGADVNDNRCYLFASLKLHMDENAARYAAPEWDEYKKYASEAVDFLRQQNLDGRLYEKLKNLTANYNDFRLDRTIGLIMRGKIGHFLPHTNFSLYEKSEITAKCERAVFFDIDNLTVSLREGALSVFAQLNLRNRGYCAVGRAHVKYENMTHVMQFATDGIFTSREKFIRPQNVNMDFICDGEGSNSFFRAPVPLGAFASVPQALCGEEIPVTYRKGTGAVLRENFAVDTPFSGYPDAIWAKVGRYEMIFNTTRPAYENAAALIVPVPENGKILDMVSGKYMEIENNSLSVPPFTCVVLRLSSADLQFPLPENLKLLNALADEGGVLLSWKGAFGAESYTVRRDGEEIASLTSLFFRDGEACPGKEYVYSVSAKNQNGESRAKEARVTLREKPQIKIGGGNPGFGEGDDCKALCRKIRDCVFFSAKAVHGGVSLTSKGFVMMRESFSDDAVYAFLGKERGKIVFRTRSKNTMYNPSGKISPLVYEFPSKGEEYFRIISDFDLHSVLAFASKDGQSWRFLLRVSLPLPSIYYAGSAAFEERNLTEYSLSEAECDAPFPLSSVEAEKKEGKCTLLFKRGLDDKFLSVFKSADGKNYTLIAENLIADSFTDEDFSGKAFYKIIPVNRHNIPGEEYVVKV